MDVGANLGRYRDVLRMMREEQLPVDEVARRLGGSVEATKRLGAELSRGSRKSSSGGA